MTWAYGAMWCAVNGTIYMLYSNDGTRSDTWNARLSLASTFPTGLVAPAKHKYTR